MFQLVNLSSSVAEGWRKGKPQPCHLIAPSHEPKVQACKKPTLSSPMQQGQSITLDLPKVAVCHQNWLMLEHSQENRFLRQVFNSVLIMLTSSSPRNQLLPCGLRIFSRYLSINIKRGQIRGELNTAACKKDHITVVNNGHQRNTEKSNR